VAECHSHAKGAFRTPGHFWCIRKAAGLTGDRAESKRASSGRLDLSLTFLLLLTARDEYHNKTSTSHSRQFCIVSCQEPCILALVTCLLPPAVIACYNCCCCSPCENQARGRSGLEGHSGEDPEQSPLRFSLIALWSTNQPRLHEAATRPKVAWVWRSSWGGF